MSPDCPTNVPQYKSKSIEKEIDIELELEVDTTAPAEKSQLNIFAYYQQRIGALDGYQFEQLQDYLKIDKLEPELIKIAIDKAADNSKRNFGYVNAILKNWAKNSITTVVKQQEEQRQFHDTKAKGEDELPQPEPTSFEDWKPTAEKPF